MDRKKIGKNESQGIPLPGFFDGGVNVKIEQLDLSVIVTILDAKDKIEYNPFSGISKKTLKEALDIIEPLFVPPCE